MQKRKKLLVDKLSFGYAGKPVLKQLSFVLHEQDVLGVIGSSGSGKTSLLKVLAGKLEPEAGRVMLDEIAIAKPSERLIPGDERVSLVAQDFDLNQYVQAMRLLTGSDVSGEQKEWKQGQRLRKQLRLDSLEGQQTHQISGGQKQRLALGKAVLQKTQMLLLDEPFSNLDYPLKAKLQELILQKWKSAFTVLVTHEPADVLRMCDKILVLKDGKKVQYGTTEEVFEKPKSLYVASLLGSINKLSAAFCRALGVQFSKARANYLVRPHTLTIADEGCLCVVKKQYFNGKNYALSCWSPTFNEFVELYSSVPHVLGEECLISAR